MPTPEKRNPAGRPGLGSVLARQNFQVQNASADALLQRLDKVRKSGKGWIACCPAHRDKSPSLAVTEDCDRVLLHCFAGCRPDDVLAAVGMTWADIQPPKHWPQSPDECRQASRAIREAGWSAALATLALEAKVVLIAGRQLSGCGLLSDDDEARLALAVERVHHSANVFVDASRWRPTHA